MLFNIDIRAKLTIQKSFAGHWKAFNYVVARKILFLFAACSTFIIWRGFLTFSGGAPFEIYPRVI